MNGGGRANNRSQSEVLGIVLLLGLVAVVATTTIILGATVIDDAKGAIQFESAENTMREVDARLSRVAYSDNKVETLDLTGQSNVTVRGESYMNITVNRDATCRATIGMGSIRTTTNDDRVVAYEGGGVWQKSEGGVTVMSPPDFQYEQGTINFPLVNVSGTSQAGGRFTATKNISRSRERSREITQQLTGAPVCKPIDNVTISVNSSYYEGWGRYFEQVTPVSSVPTYDSNQTARLSLNLVGSATPVSVTNSGVSASTDYVAKVNVIGTEGTVRRSGFGPKDNTIGPSGASHYAELNDPYSLRVRVNGTNVYTPWRDDPGGSIGSADWSDGTKFPDDNLNKPWVGGVSNARVTLKANSKFALEAAIHNCDQNFNGTGNTYQDANWDNTSAPPERYDTDGDGTVDEIYHQFRCSRIDTNADAVERYTQVQTNASQSASGDPNIIILGDGDRSTVDFEQKTFQENLSQLLGSRVFKTGNPDEVEADIDSNQVIFIYELSSPQSFPRGGEDYNDAVIVVTFFKQGNAANAGSLQLKISASQIEIEG
jgi:hypothetical protein